MTYLNSSVAILGGPLRVVVAHAANKNVLLVAREQRLRVLVGRTIIDHLHAWRILKDLVDLLQRDLPLELSIDTANCKTVVLVMRYKPHLHRCAHAASTHLEVDGLAVCAQDRNANAGHRNLERSLEDCNCTGASVSARKQAEVE